jgi:hypothetical protein
MNKTESLQGLNNLFNSYLKTKEEKYFTEFYINLKPIVFSTILKDKRYYNLVNNPRIEIEDIFHNSLMKLLKREEFSPEKENIIGLTITYTLNSMKDEAKKLSNKLPISLTLLEYSI